MCLEVQAIETMSYCANFWRIRMLLERNCKSNYVQANKPSMTYMQRLNVAPMNIMLLSHHKPGQCINQWLELMYIASINGYDHLMYNLNICNIISSEGFFIASVSSTSINYENRYKVKCLAGCLFSFCFKFC